MAWRRRIERQRKLDRFADLLAEHDADAGNPGGLVWQAAQKMGLSPKEGAALLQIIRRGLGPQAR